MKTNNQEGYVLATVTILAAMVFLVGSSAIYMTSIGSQTLSSEAQYNKARHASEVGLNKAIEAVTKATGTNRCGPCTSRTDCSGATGIPPVTNFVTTTGSIKPSYTYTGVPDVNGDNCFIYSRGKYGDASVIKTVIIPFKTILNKGSGFQAGNITEVDFNNGPKKAVGNLCGGPGVVANGVAPTQLSALQGEADGTPAVSIPVFPNTPPNIYTENFGPTITTYEQLHASIDNKVNEKMANTSSSCKFSDTSVDCTANGDTVTCGTISINATKSNCPNGVVIKSKDFTASGGSTTNTAKFVVNTTGNLNITATINGLLTSKGSVNLNAGNNPVNAIMIGTKDSSLNISGGGKSTGLYFVANSRLNAPIVPLPKPNVNILMAGNTSFKGAIAVDGNVQKLRVNGSGNGGGNNNDDSIYNLQYSPEAINDADTEGFLPDGSCEPISPSVSVNLSRTRMTMF